MKNGKMLKDLQATAVIIKETEELVDEANYYTKNLINAKGIIVIKILAYIFFSNITFNILNFISETTNLLDSMGLFGLMLFVVPYIVMRLTIAIICKLNHTFKLKKYHNRLIEIENKVEQNINMLQKDSILPKAYWNSFAINKIIEYSINLRADSLKEAINLFENE